MGKEKLGNNKMCWKCNQIIKVESNGRFRIIGLTPLLFGFEVKNWTKYYHSECAPNYYSIKENN